MNITKLAERLKKLSRVELQNLVYRCGLTGAQHNKLCMSHHLSRHLIVTYLQEQLEHTVKLVKLKQTTKTAAVSNFRTFSSALITNVMTIESTLFTILTILSGKDQQFEVKSSFPTAIYQYLNRMIKKEINSEYSGDEIANWLCDLGKKSEIKEYLLGQDGNKSNRKKKNFSKLLAQYWVKDHANLCSKELTNYFNNSKKKDDLADCLLQGLVYLGCRRFSIHEANKWIIDKNI
ncbi:9149_t:CDS:2 [Diversispora eburnea]|uniref:9149_t:CDS:1 n=1 Tax=Diversispora eburnea TaxID=1213867 RepID=A0A9N9FQH9_9GLOM|nr:9149_t:CDS:2 [Diversispora eburnea]